MGQRHQLFIIARLHGRYRCLAAFHHQWLYGVSAILGASRVLSALRVPFNARTIASELSVISAAEIEEQTIVAPYLFGVFMTGFRCNLDGKHPGPLVTSLTPLERELKPSQCNNNDGITVFDVTDTSNVRYCFASVTGIEGDDSAIENCQPLTAEHDPAIASEVQIVQNTPLITLEALADAWPDDFVLQADAKHETAPNTGTFPKVEEASIPSLTELSISTVIGELLDPEAEKADDAVLNALMDRIVTRAALDTLRSGLLQTSRLNHNGAILLARSLSAESDDLIDLKPFLHRDLLIKESFVAVLRDAAPSGTVLDISGCDWIDEGILREALLSLSKVERVIAFACPLLDDLKAPLSVSCLLTTGQLRLGPTVETLQDDNVLTEDLVCWAQPTDIAPGLSVFLYIRKLKTYRPLDPKNDERRYGLELAHFSVSGILKSMATLAKFLEKSSGRDFSSRGLHYPFRGCFHSLGGGELGELPSNIPSAPTPRAKPGREESIWMRMNGNMEPTDGAVAPVPRSPGWTLVWDTRGVTPQMEPIDERYGQKCTLYESVGNPDLCAPRYGFVQWTAESEAGAETKLVPVQCVSARDWVKTLAPGHGRISEEELQTFERAMAEYHVRAATLDEVMAAASWPAELWQRLAETSRMVETSVLSPVLAGTMRVAAIGVCDLLRCPDCMFLTETLLGDWLVWDCIFIVARWYAQCLDTPVPSYWNVITLLQRPVVHDLGST
ncbi:hypothetical protein BKA62DRAFT_622119 [Auriculariales sp. MPI-PUGE-AT-0066]|nr:hypothetical protein BKA62DRAFT_622119 [Auriculariales sp. MPI-PUGE-AT-0066]